jgi:NNP family nitrate/nitrite transporter-like MFS transporter
MRTVYGFAAGVTVLPLPVMIIFAKEPPDLVHATLWEHLSCLFEKDGWYFNPIYIITSAFLGLATYLSSFYIAKSHITTFYAANLVAIRTLIGSVMRVLGW